MPKRKLDIPRTPAGAIDFDSIQNRVADAFWSEKLARAKTRGNLRAEKFPNFYEQNASEIIAAIGDWLKSADAQKTSDFEISGFIYGGDPTLKGVSGAAEDRPEGIVRALASKIMRFRNLSALYYYYCKEFAQTSDAYCARLTADHFAFARLLVENVRAMLADIWNNGSVFASNAVSNPVRTLGALENLFFEYDSLKPPARKTRILNAVETQTALPDVSQIRERYHLLSAIDAEELQAELEAAVKSGKEVLDEFIESLSDIWNEHITATDSAREPDAERLNGVIDGILENITFGELREAEAMKNAESGEYARKAKKAFERAKEEESRTGRHAAEERFFSLRPVRVSLDDSGAGAKAAEKISAAAPIYCPDDFSDSVWEKLSENEKLYLMCCELASDFDSSAGIKGILREHTNANVSLIPANIVRAVVGEILGADIPPITSANKAVATAQIRALCRKNGCFADVKFTMHRLVANKAGGILRSPERASAADSRTAQKALEICSILAERKQSKTEAEK